MWSVFYVSVGHLYVLFGEVSVHFFCHLNWIICFLGVEFGKFIIDLGYQPFICNVTCKYLLPFHGLPFSFVDSFLCHAEAFYLDEVPLEMCLARSRCGQCRRGYCLCSLGFWWFPVSHLGLSPILSLSLGKTFLKKLEKSQIYKLTIHLKELEKEQHIKPKPSQRREIIKFREEINLVETKRMLELINKMGSCSLKALIRLRNP